MKRILAIIVSYNGLRWIDRCLGSLVSTEGVDVLVVDNGSTDGTREHIRDCFPGVELLCKDDNPGFGAANNAGLRLALERGYDFVYLMNQDAWVEEGAIASLVEAWDPSFALLSPVQKAASGELDANFRRKCGALACGEGVCEVPFVMAAHWLLSADAVKKVGGFSPAFRQYGEDDNYIDRARFHGLKAGVLAGVGAVHDRSGRVLSRKKKMALKCTAAVVRLSDPSCVPSLRKLRVLLELAGMAVKNLSPEPLHFIPALVRRFPEIDALREESKKEGAFLWK